MRTLPPRARCGRWMPSTRMLARRAVHGSATGPAAPPSSASAASQASRQHGDRAVRELGALVVALEAAVGGDHSLGDLLHGRAPRGPACDADDAAEGFLAHPSSGTPMRSA